MVLWLAFGCPIYRYYDIDFVNMYNVFHVIITRDNSVVKPREIAISYRIIY